jgi:hypothetical protein
MANIQDLVQQDYFYLLDVARAIKFLKRSLEAV